MEHVTLTNLRKNSKKAHYVYFNESQLPAPKGASL